MAGQSQTVFLRNATGLVRAFTAVDALFLAIGSIIGPTTYPVFAGEWYLFPGVNIPVSFLIMGGLAIFNGIYYVLITAVMPRSGGGGYVPLSRLIHPVLGMGMSFILMTAFILNLGLIGLITITVGVSGPLGSYAILTGNTALQGFATALSTPAWGFALGTVIIVLIGLLAISGTGAIRLANKISITIGISGFLIILGILIATTQPQFQAALNQFAGAGTYQNITATAHAGGWNPPTNWIGPTLLSLPLTFFAVLGYAFNTYYGGEVRQVTRNMTFAVIGSIAFAMIFFSSISTAALNTLGSDFITSAGYLFNANPSKYPLTVPPYVNTFVAVLNGNPIVNAILIISYIAWGYFLIINFYFIVSRHFLAWSFDRAIPSRFGAVSERFHSPVWAIVVTGLLAEIALAFYAYLPTILGPVNLTYLFIAALMLDGLAGIVVAWKRKELLASMGVANKKVGGVPLIAILGAYSVILLILLFIAALLNPAIAGPFGVVTAGTIVAPFVLGVVVYLAMKQYHRSKGIDIGLAYKEIPPE